MEEVKNKYGLRHKTTGKIVGYKVVSNEGKSDCFDRQYILTIEDIKADMWLVDHCVNAECVRLHSTKWYNAQYNTPTHHFAPDDLEVVKIDVVVNAEPVEVSIPTPYEYLKQQYEKKDPRHWKRLQEEMKEFGEEAFSYDYHELILHMEEQTLTGEGKNHEKTT